MDTLLYVALALGGFLGGSSKNRRLIAHGLECLSSGILKTCTRGNLETLASVLVYEVALARIICETGIRIVVDLGVEIDAPAKGRVVLLAKGLGVTRILVPSCSLRQIKRRVREAREDLDALDEEMGLFALLIDVVALSGVLINEFLVDRIICVTGVGIVVDVRIGLDAPTSLGVIRMTKGGCVTFLLVPRSSGGHLERRECNARIQSDALQILLLLALGETGQLVILLARGVNEAIVGRVESVASADIIVDIGLRIDAPTGEIVVRMAERHADALFLVPRHAAGEFVGGLETTRIADGAAKERDRLASQAVFLTLSVKQRVASSIKCPQRVRVILPLVARADNPTSLVALEVGRLVIDGTILPCPLESVGAIDLCGLLRLLEVDVRTSLDNFLRHTMYSVFEGFALARIGAGDGPLGILVGVDVVVGGALVDLAKQATVGPRAAHGVAMLVVDGGQRIDVGLEATEGVVQVCGTVTLREPPTTRAHDDAGSDDVVDIGAHLDTATTGLDPAPVTLLDVVLISRIGVDAEVRIRGDVTDVGHVEMLGMVVRHEAAAGGEANRVLLGQVRIVDRVLGATDIGRHSGIAELLQDRGVELNLTGGRPEAATSKILALVQRRIIHTDLVNKLVVGGDRQSDGLHDSPVCLFLGLPRPVCGILAAGQTQLTPEDHVGVTIVLRLHCTTTAHEGVGCAVVGDDNRTLECASCRENVVSEQGGRGDPIVNNDQELNGLDCGEDHLGVAVRHHRVGGVDDKGTNLVGILGQDCLKDAGAMGLAEPFCRQGLAPRTLVGLGNQGITRPRSQLELVGADLLFLDRIRQKLVELQFLVGEVVHRRTGHAVATGNLKVARDRTEQLQCMGCGGGARTHLVPRAAPLDAAGGVGAIHGCRSANLLGRNAADLLSPLRRVIAQMTHEIIETVAPGCAELEVAQALHDSAVQHCQSQSSIGTGQNRQPKVSLCCRLGITRINNDALHAVVDQIPVAMHARQRRCARVHAPQDQAARAAQVGLERRPTSNAGLSHERRNPAKQCVVETVRGTELVEEASTCPVVGTGSTAAGRNALSAVLGLDLIESVSDLLDSLVVVDLLPLAFTLLSDALQHVVDATGVIDVQESTRTTTAQAALIGVIGVALDLDDVAVLDVCKNTTVGVAEVALRTDAFYSRRMDINFRRHLIPLSLFSSSNYSAHRSIHSQQPEYTGCRPQTHLGPWRTTEAVEKRG